MKKLLSLILATLLTVSMFAGCSSNNDASDKDVSKNDTSKNDEKDTSTKGTIEIEFWHSASGVKGEATDQVAADFNATVGKEKGIFVKSVYQGNDVVAKLKTVSQANDVKNFPDVGQIYGSGIPAVMKMDPLVTIDEMFAKGDASISKDDLHPSFVRAFEYKSEMIGMPFNNSTILLYYNKDHFEEVGLDPEQPPTTIAELANATSKLMKSNGNKVERYGLNVAIRRYQLSNFIGGQGDFNFYGDNEGGRTGQMTKVTFGEDGSLEKYLTEWEKLVKTGGYKPIEDNINEEFATGISSMAIMSTSRISTIHGLMGEDANFGVAYLPKVDAADKGGVSVGGGSLCLFDKGDSDKLNAAWEFIQYAASPEAQAKYSIATGYVAANLKAYELPEMKSHLESHPEYQVAINQLNESNPNVQEPFDLIPWELDAIIKDTMAEFGAGNMTVDETRDYIVEECNKKLAAYNRANN
ncbi:ABC transporter substrate-binding protein [Vallitalea sediminicola]